MSMIPNQAGNERVLFDTWVSDFGTCSTKALKFFRHPKKAQSHLFVVHTKTQLVYAALDQVYPLDAGLIFKFSAWSARRLGL